MHCLSFVNVLTIGEASFNTECCLFMVVVVMWYYVVNYVCSFPYNSTYCVVNLMQ